MTRVLKDQSQKMDEPSIDIIVGNDSPFDQLSVLYESVGWIAYTSEKRGPELRRQSGTRPMLTQYGMAIH